MADNPEAPEARVERVALMALHPDPANARRHPERNLEAIRASLARFGQTKPLVVQASSGRILAGNGTYEAMRLLGWSHCSVIRVAMTDLDATAYGIADNRTGDLAQWDLDALDGLVAELEGADVDMGDIGFTAGELDVVLGDEATIGEEASPGDGGGDDGDAPAAAAESEAAQVSDETPEPPKNPVTKPGDVWRLGAHTLICGDTLQVFGQGLSKQAAMVFCDPPYGTTQNKWDTCALPMDALWNALRRAGGKEAAYVFTAAQPFTTDVIASNRKEFRYDLVWHKTMVVGFLDAKRRPLRAHESILVFGKAPTFNPQMTTGGKPYAHNYLSKTQGHNYKIADTEHVKVTDNNGERYPTSVLQFRLVRDEEGRQHPTQKPVAMLAWLVQTYTNPGDTVGDPTAGSGTTLMACQLHDRVCHAVEQDPAYCDVIVQRWEQLTGQKARRAGAAPEAKPKAKPPKAAPKKPGRPPKKKRA